MNKDCGCGGSPAASDPQRSTGVRAGPAHGRGNGSANGPGAVGAGPIIRLNPTDGLFLKSEHLDQIQDHARALSLAVGLGTGTGVVYGYGLELSASALTASAGLAINPAGHPLQCSETLQLSMTVDNLPDLDPDGFWVVEIVPDEDTVGAENAYGAVCADPCEGVDSIAPWARSLVRLRLRPDVLSGLDAQVGIRRNWLASAYFERERRQQQPWLVPGERLPGAPGTVAPLSSRPWAEPGTAPTGAAVALGVLLRIDGVPVLDTWTARRELSGPPGERRWDGHLARRSWPVFLAQVLQFQDQLRHDDLVPVVVSQRVVVDRRGEAVDKYIAGIPKTVANWEAFKELKASWLDDEQPYEVSVEGKTLIDLGWGELPPAGYLGLTVAGVEGRAQVTRIFGETLDLRFCDVRADYVAGAVQSAQHLDRIPLDPAADPRPQVDILVPSRTTELGGLRTDAYGWVAFVRRSQPDCDDTTPEPPAEPTTEIVEVAYAFMTLDEGQQVMSRGDRPASTSVAEVEFAEGSTEVPAEATKPVELDGVTVLGVVAAASTEAEAKLAVKRSDAVLAAWGMGSLTSQPAFHPHFARPVIMFFVTARIN